jgi:hypothetical protein
MFIFGSFPLDELTPDPDQSSSQSSSQLRLVEAPSFAVGKIASVSHWILSIKDWKFWREEQVPFEDE